MIGDTVFYCLRHTEEVTMENALGFWWCPECNREAGIMTFNRQDTLTKYQIRAVQQVTNDDGHTTNRH